MPLTLAEASGLLSSKPSPRQPRLHRENLFWEKERGGGNWRDTLRQSLSLIPRTHIKTARHGVDMCNISNGEAGRQMPRSPCLASLACLVSSRPIRKPCLLNWRKKKIGESLKNGPQGYPLTSRWMCIHMYICTCTHTCTHADILEYIPNLRRDTEGK